MRERTIWTIGHSNHTAEHFVKMLKAFHIQLLADVRLLPGSNRYPWFNKEALEELLKQNGVDYLHLKELGGRRRPLKDSKNTAWRVDAFRGYADYMETPAFKKAVSVLQASALEKPTAYMCSEAVWWSCHRSLISDYLKVHGWKVLHIMSLTRADEHPYTQAAKIVNGQLDYSKPDLFSGT